MGATKPPSGLLSCFRAFVILRRPRELGPRAGGARGPAVHAGPPLDHEIHGPLSAKRTSARLVLLGQLDLGLVDIVQDAGQLRHRHPDIRR
jgi:hypothetical protein